MKRQKKVRKHQNRILPTRRWDVCPDGEFIWINWKAFEPGMSMFIPAINTRKLEAQMNVMANRLNYVLKGFERIEGGLLGMRFWRIS